MLDAFCTESADDHGGFRAWLGAEICMLLLDLRRLLFHLFDFLLFNMCRCSAAGRYVCIRARGLLTGRANCAARTRCGNRWSYTR